MTTPTNESQQKKDSDFGLPKAEFKPIAAKGNQWFKITAAISVIVLSIGEGIIYWFFGHKPAVDPSEKALAMFQEQRSEVSASDICVPPPTTKQEQQETEFTKAPKAPEKIDEAKSSSTTYTIKPSKRGTITRVNTIQGYYYIVLGSYIDEDLALDYARILAKKGIHVTLIAPSLSKYYFRLAIKHEGTLRSAYEKAEKLKDLYGTDIWVIKY